MWIIVTEIVKVIDVRETKKNNKYWKEQEVKKLYQNGES